jgi:hypothetical protein
MIVAIALSVLLAVVRIDAQQDCTGLEDGIYGAGCHSYTECTNGVGETVECDAPEYVYNELIGRCDLEQNTPPPCGANNNCAGLPDGSYADMTNGQECEAFFTCRSGENIGTTPCNPPDSDDDLVFDSKYQICNWRHLVLPPCGTYGVSPPPRF